MNVTGKKFDRDSSFYVYVMLVLIYQYVKLGLSNDNYVFKFLVNCKDSLRIVVFYYLCIYLLRKHSEYVIDLLKLKNSIFVPYCRVCKLLISCKKYHAKCIF